MSLGWFSKIFGPKDSAKKEDEKAIAFTIESAANLLDSKYGDIVDPFLEVAKSKYNGIQSVVKNLQNNTMILDNAKYADKVDPHLLAVVMGRRKIFVQRMNELAAKLKAPMEFTFDSVLDFHNSAVLALEHANATTLDGYMAITELFKHEASQVAGNLKKLENLLTDFSVVIKEKNEALASIQQGKIKLKEMSDAIYSVDRKKKYVEELESKLKHIDADCSKISGDISSLENSDEWRSYNELLKEKNGFENELKSVLDEMSQNISILIKPSKRLKNLVDNGFVIFPNKKFIENFLDDPVAAILNNDASFSNSLLECMEENILNKKIDLKDKENKILESISYLKKDDLFSKRKSKFESLSKKTNDLKNAIRNSPVMEKRGKLETDLESARRIKNECESDLEKERSSIEPLRNLAEKKKSEFELQISAMEGKKITLDAPAI